MKKRILVALRVLSACYFLGWWIWWWENQPPAPISDLGPANRKLIAPEG